jgi:hypothetical protein
MLSRSQRLRLLLAAVVPAALLLQGTPAHAAAPANDARAAAHEVGALPATLRGTTVDATLDEDEPFSGCGGPTKNSVWYALRTAEARAIIVALDAGGEMDAAVDVYQRQRSQLNLVSCRATDRRGEATIDLDAATGADYLIRVAPLANSATEAFTLRVIAPDPPAQPPGQPLPAGGTSAAVDRLANPDDAWSFELRKGRTYRMNFVNPRRSGCPQAALYAPGVRGFGGAVVRTLECDAQTVYTPPRSGRYMVYVRAPRASRARLPYRLRVGLAGQDDTAPGLEIENDDRVGGALAGAELDVVDLYRFSVARRSDLTIRLDTTRDFRVVLLSDGGRRLACGCGPAGNKQVEQRIRPGRYFLAVRARDGDGGRYVLSRLARTITSSRMLAGGKRSTGITVGSAIDLSLRVSPTVDGGATLLVERFDPLAGWLFDARLHPRLRNGRASVSFRPPTVGRWRVTGAFDGTRRASPSNGGTATFSVTEPVTDD